MQPIVIALLGAGSRSFGPETVRDVLLSETLGPRRVELRLTLSKTRCFGLCHGVWMGMEQVAYILDKPVHEMEMEACGINHFSWFQTIRDRRTGDDLYPRLRAAEREGSWLADWHEIGLGRILLRRFGLYPSPASNHVGEYIGWAHEFCANELDWFYDPADGVPWETGKVPDYMSMQDAFGTDRPFKKQQHKPQRLEEQPLEPSGELAIPIIESLACGEHRRLDAINVPNRGFIPNLPDEMVVELPATAATRCANGTARVLHTSSSPRDAVAVNTAAFSSYCPVDTPAPLLRPPGH